MKYRSTNLASMSLRQQGLKVLVVVLVSETQASMCSLHRGEKACLVGNSHLSWVIDWTNDTSVIRDDTSSFFLAINLLSIFFFLREQQGKTLLKRLVKYTSYCLHYSLTITFFDFLIAGSEELAGLDWTIDHGQCSLGT